MSGWESTALQSITTLFRVGTISGFTEGELLERFTCQDREMSEAAFEALVLRHGPMVFKVCQNILGNPHDAQDAFQATWLILATKAGSIRRKTSVACWLYGVASRVAIRDRSQTARRSANERRMAFLPDSRHVGRINDDSHKFEALHEEVNRLPLKYRECVVLCYLEGMTLEAASERLRCPVGTLGVRLMRARQWLKHRLSRRDVMVPAGLLAAGVTSTISSASSALPEGLVSSTVSAVVRRAANKALATPGVALAKSVLWSMVVVKIAKAVCVIPVVLAALACFGQILAGSGILAVKESRAGQPPTALSLRVGDKVVTKYSAPLKNGAQLIGDDIFLIYTIDELRDDLANLASTDISGWIAVDEIVPLDQAVDFYTNEIKADPSNGPAYHFRGVIRESRAEYDKAVSDLTDAIRLDPGIFGSYVDRGRIFLERKKEYDRAISDFSQAIRIEPTYAYTYVQRGDAWFRKVDLDKSITDFDQAIRLDPRYARAYCDRGASWLSKKEFDKAITDLNEAIRLTPNYTLAHRNRASAWASKGDMDQAMADYDEAIRLDPDKAPAHDGRGLVWANKNEHRKAIADFDQAIRLDPKYADAYFSRGQSWSALEEFDRAIADYDVAIRIDPKAALTFLNRGLAWARKQDYDKAIADCTEAIRLGSVEAWSYHWRGRALADKGEHRRAIADYEESIRLDPSGAQTWFDRGRSWDLLGEYDKAVNDFTEAIRLDPKHVIAYNDRGEIRAYRRREYDKALADFAEAIRLDSNDSWTLTNQSWLLATCPDEKFRDGKRAVKSATRACELSEWKDPRKLGTLAAACAEAGDFTKAVEWQEKANAIYAEPEDKQRGQERLELYKNKRPYREDPSSDR